MGQNRTSNKEVMAQTVNRSTQGFLKSSNLDFTRLNQCNYIRGIQDNVFELLLSGERHLGGPLVMV